MRPTNCERVRHPYTEWGMQVKSRLNGVCRTNGWLATALGVSLAYLSNTLRGVKPVSDEYKQRVNVILEAEERNPYPDDNTDRNASSA